MKYNFSGSHDTKTTCCLATWYFLLSFVFLQKDQMSCTYFFSLNRETQFDDCDHTENFTLLCSKQKAFQPCYILAAI